LWQQSVYKFFTGKYLSMSAFTFLMQRISSVQMKPKFLGQFGDGWENLQKLPEWAAIVFGLDSGGVELVLGYDGPIATPRDSAALFRGTTPEYSDGGIMLQHPEALVSLVSAKEFGDGLELSDRLHAFHIGPEGISIPRDFLNYGIPGRLIPTFPAQGFAMGGVTTALSYAALYKPVDAHECSIRLRALVRCAMGSEGNIQFYGRRRTLELRTEECESRRYDSFRISLE
jgi:hypothetical protein